ncbi:hypothetical protein HYC85_002335 [Camellia sinensis]|uniref:Uncharacterized protein n=1 Tax=Camellia sinensis TaxID=4442 RepID=A0A7J7I9C2_CAMSI|nr:hypothetical protein HYC85_002335 [Camellia sinensis]
MATYSGRNKKIEMAKRHIEEIRKRKLSVGRLTLDLHNAVTRLSSDLNSTPKTSTSSWSSFKFSFPLFLIVSFPL